MIVWIPVDYLDTLLPEEPDVSDFVTITRIIHGRISVNDAIYVKKKGFRGEKCLVRFRNFGKSRAVLLFEIYST